MPLLTTQHDARNRGLTRVDSVEQAIVMRDHDLPNNRRDVLVVHGQGAAHHGQHRLIEADIPLKTSNRHGSTSTSRDRKSTRLNSSHVKISYAVFCLKKKTT